MGRGYFFKYLLINLSISYCFGQTSVIKELHFPYQAGYEYTMTDTTLIYDQYNFPKEQQTTETRYSVTDDPENKNQLIFHREEFDKEKNETTKNVTSYLTLGKKGMSWWRIGEKPTNAIKLPMKKGSEWKSILNSKKATMTCIVTDTILSTMYGNISCFGVSYEMVNQEEKDYKVYTIVKEYYNMFAGKVHSEWLTYVYVFETKKNMLYGRTLSYITYSNLSEDQKALIK